MQFRGPTKEIYRKRLRGVEFISYIPENAWIVKLEIKRRKILNRKKVKFMTPLLPRFRIGEILEQKMKTVSGSIEIRVSSFQGSKGFKEKLEGYSPEVKKVGESVWRAEATVNEIREIAGIKATKRISSTPPSPTALNIESRDLIDVDKVQGSPLNLSGKGLTGAIWDGGWAGDHSDLNYTKKKRTVGDKGENCGNDCSVASHPTHVAGTMVGGGILDYTYRGMAP
ncbi:MAG: hypothetical protein ABEJ72_06135, partial [Candidatus Aenigmatarchaeota archaeon]